MRITNKHKTDLGLPNGQVLRSGEPTNVRDWGKIKENSVVAAWLARGILTEDGADDGDTATSADKDELIARLTELGVKADKRKTVEKLQAMLAEAEEDEKFKALLGSGLLPSDVVIADGKTVPLGDVVARAHADSGLTVDAWNALSAEDRDALLANEVQRLMSEAAQG